MTKLRAPLPLPAPNPHAQEPCPAPPPPWEHPHTLISILGRVLTTTFPPLDNSHFLQMWEFLKHPSGLQDGNLIVV